jgi:hypothetical protein
MPESSGSNALDTGLHRYDELIRAYLNMTLQGEINRWIYALAWKEDKFECR